MLLNNNTRIARLSLNAGPIFDHHNTCSSLSPVSKSTKRNNNNKNSLPTVKQRQHRSCQSGCNSNSDTSVSSSSSIHDRNKSNELKVGQKVSVSSLCAIGTIRFIGSTTFQRGIWAGIEMDIVGTGKNDGSIKNTRYFHCPPETGIFILVNKVTPLNDASSRSSSTTTQSLDHQQQQQRQSKIPPKRTTLSTVRQRCLSLDQKPTASVSASTPKKKVTPSFTSASTSTRTPRAQPGPLICSTSRKPSQPNLTPSTRTVSAQQKTVTPVLPKASPPLQHPSKSTRRTVTPMTKKRNSTGSPPPTTTKQPLSPSDHGASPRKSKSTSTRKVVTQDELNKMHLLLEQSRQEKQRLSEEMNGKEAVWERLVTAKESYALKVQDMQVEISRLQDSLHLSQQQVTHLESQLTNRSSPTLPMASSEMEQQYIRRIEKLDRLVREWQQDAQDSHHKVQQQQRTHNAQMEQLRRDLAERDQVTAAMEREYETAKQTNRDTVRHYETILEEWTIKRDKTIKAKDDQIERLDRMIEELKSCHFLLPPSPDHDDDDDDEPTTVPDLVHQITSGNPSMYSSRRRLEQQLELTTKALDDVQLQHKATLMENENLRDQLTHMHAASSVMNQQYRHVQNELAKEISDKRQVMEERDAALQGMDEDLMETRLKQMEERLTTTQDQMSVARDRAMASEEKLQQVQYQYRLLQDAHDGLKKECGRLMDQLEEDRIHTIDATKPRRRTSKPTPFAMHHCSGIIMPISPVSDTSDQVLKRTSKIYCEICEVEGHDVMGCKAMTSRMMYCVNCDVFDTHATADCPNQDETF